MATPAIRVEGLCKEYAIGGPQSAARSLRETLGEMLALPARGSARQATTAAAQERFWALRDVSFEVQPGEVVGIIGGNGAGKSTLLKILSRITAPTQGHVELHGRLASLLEVGTGFHPELTGRENIFLNGAILGLRRREIERKFDAIVSFAEIEKFLDTPVKRYSSGMYVRLAFAIAAHLDPDILVVDEVLAVGDAPFQRKCLGTMQEAAGSGRTVLFVSHNMAAVQALCTRGLFLKEGKVALDASATNAISIHLQSVGQMARQPLTERKDRTGDGRLRFVDFWLENGDGERVSSAILGRTTVLCFSYRSVADLERVYVAFDLRDPNGEAVTNCNTADAGQDFSQVQVGTGVFRCTLDRFPIRGGRYTGNIYCSAGGEVCDFLKAAIQIDVDDADFYGTGSLRNPCRVMLDQRWSRGATEGGPR